MIYVRRKINLLLVDSRVICSIDPEQCTFIQGKVPGPPVYASAFRFAGLEANRSTTVAYMRVRIQHSYVATLI